MNTKGDKKLKNVCNANSVHQTNDCRIVDNEGMMINKNISLSICLKPQADVPHPRYLCFAYPFGKSSPKKHCIKCYCYVCEKIAPCKNWSKTPKRHCDANEKEDKWILEKKLSSKLAESTTMLYHKFIVTASYPRSVGLDQPHQGFGAGLVSNKDGEWVVGFSMRLSRCSNIVETCDNSAPFYFALLEALQFAWSKGFRCLEIKLGFMFHEGFWLDFTKDPMTSKFHLCANNPCYQALDILKGVEGYLNREWFINVKNTESYEEESAAILVAALPKRPEQALQVYDFRTHPYKYAKATMTRAFMGDVSGIVSHVLGNDISTEDKKYYGLI